MIVHRARVTGADRAPTIDAVAAKERGRTIDCFVVVDEASSYALAGRASASIEGGSPDLVAKLGAALLRRTREWAEGFAGDDVTVLEYPRDSAKAASSTADTVLLLRPALVRLGPSHASDLFEDLDNGCGVVIGPTLAGGWYLLALSPGDPELIEAAGDGGPGASGRLLAVASTRNGVEVGLLRAERDIAADSDLRAAAADPLVDMEVARLLSGLGAAGPRGQAD